MTTTAQETPARTYGCAGAVSDASLPVPSHSAADSSPAARPLVLHVITRMDAGGAATNTLLGIELTRAAGFESLLAYGRTHDPDGGIARGVDGRGIRRVCLPALVRPVAPLRDLLALAQLVRLVRRSGCDLVHTHTSKAGVLGRLAARWCGVPAVHTPHGHIFYGYFGRAATRFFVSVERRLARHTERIVSLTDQETSESLDRAIGRREQYRTIPSGVPLARFRDIPAGMGAAFRAECGIASDAVVFVSVGRLVRVKGFDVLLRAFAAAGFDGACRLLIVGDGEERPALEHLAGELAIASCVRFSGHRGDVRPALRAADAFVLAGRNEGMGRAVVEAMAAGLPVVVTRVGGLVCLVRDGENGLIVPPDDTASLARALREVAGSEDLRRRLGAAGSASVYPEYDQQTMGRRLAELYREVLRPAGHPPCAGGGVA